MNPSEILTGIAEIIAALHPDLVRAIGIEAGVLLIAIVVVLVRARRRARTETPVEAAPETEALRPAREASSSIGGDRDATEAERPLRIDVPEAVTEAAHEPSGATPIGVAPALVESPAEAAPELPPVETTIAAASEPARAPAAGAPESVVTPRPRRLRDRLRRTSEALIGRLEGVLGSRRVDRDLLEELEALLFTADLGVATAENLLETVRKRASGGDEMAVRAVLREAILGKLRRVELAPERALATVAKPHVVLVLGVNGSGKTTTIGKLAARHVAAGRRVVLGAGDTFRAAAIEQLQAWGERAGAEVIAGTPGGDPSAVAFDTVKAAIARGADIAIIDTAGRLQTKVQLVEELKKIVRVIDRELPGAPHESLLVLDSNTGQNAISQARVFVEAGRVSGLVLTKLDGTAKGGVIVGLADEFGIPVRYVGVGEGVEDLRDFVASEFVGALFGDDGEVAA